MTPEMAKRASPEFVAPMVVSLCSEEFSDSGHIYFAGAGVYCRAALVTGLPVPVAKGDVPPSAEEVMARIDEIKSLKGAREYGSLEEQFAELKPYLG